MSKAVIAEPPSSPFITKFLSDVLTVSSTSPELFAISNTDVPASFIVTFAPSASRIISPALSSVKSPDALVTVDPSIVILSATREPPVIAPVVVIVDAPVFMLPNPLVIVP